MWLTCSWMVSFGNTISVFRWICLSIKQKVRFYCEINRTSDYVDKEILMENFRQLKRE